MLNLKKKYYYLISSPNLTNKIVKYAPYLALTFIIIVLLRVLFLKDYCKSIMINVT